MKEGDKVVHKSGIPGEITKRWYWEHSGFEFYRMCPHDPELPSLYGNLEDFQPAPEEASVPQ